MRSAAAVPMLLAGPVDANVVFAGPLAIESGERSDFYYYMGTWPRFLLFTFR